MPTNSQTGETTFGLWQVHTDHKVEMSHIRHMAISASFTNYITFIYCGAYFKRTRVSRDVAKLVELISIRNYCDVV